MTDPIAKKTVYATFSGPINEVAVQKFFQACAGTMNAKVETLHIMFQSAGGNVGDGIALHNYFKQLPINLHLYNCGYVASIAVIAFLGAKHRYSSASASFMVHRTTFNPPTPTEATRLRAYAENAELDDNRTRSILDAALKIGREELDDYLIFQRQFGALKAVEIGLVDSIRDFISPTEETVFNL